MPLPGFVFRLLSHQSYLLNAEKLKTNGLKNENPCTITKPAITIPSQSAQAVALSLLDAMWATVRGYIAYALIA